MLLLIDNYDSFTYNLVHYFQELGQEVCVFRNDQLDVEEITRINPEQIVVSPGPCDPQKAGISPAVIKTYQGKYPILGVCLGHQCIAQVFGANIIHAPRLMHGKTYPVYHRNSDILKGLPSPFKATRYHSLVVEPGTLDPSFKITAWSTYEDQFEAIMAIEKPTLSLYGVQFHPEAILTQQGHFILKQFLTLSKFHQARQYIA